MNLRLILFAGALLLVCSSDTARCYSPDIDGSLSDWLLPPPPVDNVNTGHLVTDVDGRGEYVWLDLAGDERTDMANPDPESDLLGLRITGDSTYVYIGAWFQDLTLAPGQDGVVQLQIAIDTDLMSGSGQSWLAHFADTRIAAEARWERLVLTTFGSGGAAPQVYDQNFVPVVTANAAQAYSADEDAVEIRVRWLDLGLAGVPAGPLRFSAAVFRVDLEDRTYDIGGGIISNVLDAVTNNRDPGGVYNTWYEVSDAVLNYYWDIWFNLTPAGDPAAPLLVSELYYVTDGDDTELEFIEVFNATNTTIELNGYKLGDEENVTQNAEAMIRLGAGLIGPFETRVLAAQGYAFRNHFGFHPTWEQQDTTPIVPNAGIYPAWSTGLLFRLDNGGDEVLLLDPSDTVIDVATYENGSYPGTNPHAEVLPGTSLHRVDIRADSGDCGQDFAPLSPPDPFGYPGGPTPTPVPIPSAGTAGLLLLLVALTAALTCGLGKR